MKKNYRSFTAGELAEEMYGRHDVDKYGSGCMILKDWILMAEGGAFKRPGMRFMCPVGDSARKVRLIRFEFSTEQAYALEFGHEYMRVHKDRGQVLNAAQNITAATQASPGVITCNGHGYTDGQEVFIAQVGGMWQLNLRNFLVDNATTNTFTLTDLQGNPIDTTAYEAYTSGGVVASIYQVDTQFTEDDIFDLYTAQSADILTITKHGFDPMELSRTAHTAWTLTTASFQPDMDHPTGLSAARDVGTGSDVYRYRVTAIKEEDLEESLVGIQATKTITNITQADPAVVTVSSHGYSTGEEVYLDEIVGMTELNDVRYKITVVDANNFSLNGVDSTAYTAYSSGGVAGRTHAEITNNLSTSGNQNEVSWTAVPGAVKYNVYKEKSGTYGFIGVSESTSFIDDNIDPDVSITAPRARNPFKDANQKPAKVGFHQQRRIFANTLEKPDGIFMSRAGMYSNMSVSVPNQNDDAISFSIASGKVNAIQHLIPFRELLAMTKDQEWKITANGPYTPTTMEATPETEYGAASVPPIMIGNSALFAAKYSRTVRDYAYTFEADGYDGNDLSVLGKHLFKDRFIKDWDYAQEPDRLVWAAMSDGILCTLTYMREHRIWGWARHVTQGEVESVCVVPNEDERRDDVYFVVKRSINGVDHRYIEYLSDYIDDVQDAFFVDCGISYDGSPITDVRGLWHLEGEEVTILADGNVLPKQTVTGGQITLATAASKIHVGLDYVSELQPMTPEAELQSGTTKGEPKKINTFYAEVIRTRGLKGGQTPDDEVFGEMSPVFADLDLSNTIDTFTGLVDIAVEGHWDDGYVAPYLRHDLPLPAKVLSITPIFE